MPTTQSGKQVFHVKNNKYTYDEAKALCKLSILIWRIINKLKMLIITVPSGVVMDGPKMVWLCIHTIIYLENNAAD